MDIIKRTYFKGKNIYCHRPIYYYEIDLGKYGQKESKEFNNFNDELLSLLPNLAKHQCGVSEEFGFRNRLEEGTFFGHIIEHVALEILTLLGYSVRYGKTRIIKEPSHYFSVFECPMEEIGDKVADLAINLVKGILQKNPINLPKELEKLHNFNNQSKLGPSTMAIYEAAKNRKIPVKRFDSGGSILQLGLGVYLKLVEATITSQTSCVGVDIACDKTLTKKVLEKSGISVPFGKIAKTEEEALKIAKEIGTPVVVKPCDGNQGKGVTLNLETETEIRSAFKLAENYSKNIIVEKHITGKHYRILVINGEVVAVADRIPAHVVGDGEHTIKELIDLENQNPLRGYDHDQPLTKIKVDPVIFMVLARQNMTINYIPHKDQIVFLRENANISTGGIAMDVTDEIHKDNVIMAKRIAKVVGLDIAGIDLVTDDISKPVTKTGGAVIEVNAAPGIRMHLFPSHGKPRPVGEKIVDYLYPEGTISQIPIISITGTNGKTTTTRLISHILQQKGLVVGSTSTDGIYINDVNVMEGDNTGPISAQAVLDDPTVEIAVLETARGGIVKRGLGYDLADVAVVTNLGEDHLGQDGLESIDDLFFIKSLVVEAVKENGYLVLNADDPYVVKMANKNPKAKVIYFSMTYKNNVLKKHLASGGVGIYLKDSIIYMVEGEKPYPIISTSKVPITVNGKAIHNVENAMASIGAMISLGIEKKEIISGLQTFDSNKHNPGRANIYQGNDITVLLDYGHNKEGYKKVLDLAKEMDSNHIILVLGAPGDRLDDQLKELGTVASPYGNYFIVKEDENLRGRKMSEVASLICKGLMESGVKREKVEIINDETKAIAKAMDIAQKGDLIVIFYEKFHEASMTVENCLKRIKTKAKKIV
ncbi:cyanophycin synthetase [Alkalicella caledoniensis]|uniref:Cyanophycin synthetase n=1 Tax=Alkalicella caledoniensis TaxID=2731377 RepID=A0A7G9W871_ALKCA|nr:cyanophycin synthetase [Alkalicella caledoniensis]QNO14883.1 cyanophycin synthetase [Alkalicella caledoniensis]